MKDYYVYILTNHIKGTLYTGVTSDLLQRIYQHKNKITEGFTSRYALNKLVYYEMHNDVYTALTREKNIKAWNRAWKIELIEKENPQWTDLYDALVEFK